MKRNLKIFLAFFLVLCPVLADDEPEASSYIEPIEGVSKILDNKEFEEAVVVFEKISDNEFLSIMKDEGDVEIFVYNSTTMKNESKLKFKTGDDEISDERYIIDGKLNFLTVNEIDDGTYVRNTVIDLKTFKILSADIIYTTMKESDFDIEEANKDIAVSQKAVDKGIFTKEMEEMDVDDDENDYPYIQMSDDKKKIIIYNLIKYEDEMSVISLSVFDKDFKRIDKVFKILDSTFYENDHSSTLLVEITDKNDIVVLQTHQDEDKDTRWFTAHLYKDKTWSVLKKEFPEEIEGEDEYGIRDVYVLGNTDNKIELFLLVNDELDLYTPDQVVLGFGRLTVDFSNKTLEAFIKPIPEEQREKLGHDDELLTGSVLNGVFRKDGKYYVVMENLNIRMEVIQTQYIRTVYYYHQYGPLNVLCLDDKLDVVWNKAYPDRDFIERLTAGRKRSLPGGPNLHKEVVIMPELNGDVLSFNYFTTEPDDFLTNVKFDIREGKEIASKNLFEIDEGCYYSNLNNYPIGNNQYVGLYVDAGDYMILKYEIK